MDRLRQLFEWGQRFLVEHFGDHDIAPQREVFSRNLDVTRDDHPPVVLCPFGVETDVVFVGRPTIHFCQVLVQGDLEV